MMSISSQTNVHDAVHGLSPSLTQLVGRQRELDDLCALVRRNTTRSATLTGPGGVGKTRLVQQAAAHLHDTDGTATIFVDLTPIVDPELVPAAVARALNIQGASDQSLIEQVRQWLGTWSGLLVLDNFEQVIGAAPFVSRL